MFVRSLFATAWVVMSAGSALAAAPPATGDERRLILASGQFFAPPRLTDADPGRAQEAWQKFQKERGARWQAWFDEGRATRVFGGFVAAPGSVAQPDAAEKFAREFLEKHLALWAPGAVAQNFVLAANDLTAGQRTVSFLQTHHGLPVEGGQINFRFKNDRLFMVAADVWPLLNATVPDQRLDRAQAGQAALTWINEAVGAGRVHNFRGPLVLVTGLNQGVSQGRIVYEVTVNTRQPIGRWATYVDAKTGQPVARRQTLMFGAGQAQMDTPERYPGGQRNNGPALYVNATVNGQRVTLDAQGQVNWKGTGSATVSFGAVGPRVIVSNEAGPEAQFSGQLSDGGNLVWSAAEEEQVDAQLTTYVASHAAVDRAKRIAPRMSWLNTNQLQANVNLDDVCNAFSDGETINFYRSGQGCENTARLPDVVYHEFGHAFHFHAIIPGAGRFDGALSEGASDYFSAVISNDSAMGRGFFFDERPLREVNPAGREWIWPDNVSFDTHQTGLIFAGAMWDLRVDLLEQMGPNAGETYADSLLLAALQRAVDIPTTYLEVLAADDDDGDLGNGTPNNCLIDEHFASHGLADLMRAGPGLGYPVADGLRIFVPVNRRNDCPGTEVTESEVAWSIRGQPGQGGTINFSPTDGGLEAVIPPQAAGTVVNYTVTIRVSNGSALIYPNNPADPAYEVYVGPVEVIYCTDFEGDPAAEGWSPEIVVGEASEEPDWEHGISMGAAGSGDPALAHSGGYVYGTDLGLNDADGRYGPNRQVVLNAPNFDVSGYETVRLQYWRWLTVQDGFYDQARILNNGEVVWTNRATEEMGTLNHLDKEWRFHDVDLTPTISNNSAQVSFDLTSDRRRRYGGWTIDDFCIVGTRIVCGNGVLERGEICDDGNLTNGDGCEASCVATPAAVCGNGIQEANEACDDGNQANNDGCEANCTQTPACTVNCVPEPTLQIEDEGCKCAHQRGRAGTWVWALLLPLLWVRRRSR